MNYTNYISKLHQVLFLTVVLSLFCGVQRNYLSAQDKIDNSKVILDTLPPEIDTAGFFERMLQAVKFKKNREEKEQERIYDYLKELIDNKTINIDTATVYQIIQVMDSLKVKDEMNYTKIDSVLDVYVEFKTKSEEVTDSLRTQMSAVIQENSTINTKEKRDLMDAETDHLNEIKKVEFSCVSNLSPIDSVDVKDSVRYYFKRCLKPKIKVIGWYYWRQTDEYKRYDYNYLSAINIKGYDLAQNGTNKKKAFISDCNKSGGVIKSALLHNCDVHLSVYSHSPSEITRFLYNSNAQKTLFTQLRTLIDAYQLSGINLFFDNIKQSDREAFVDFVSRLKNEVLKQNVELYITVPALKSESSYNLIEAYDFNSLNPLVDYYLVRTGEMANGGSGMAQAQTPLFNSSKYGNRTVETTMDYYNSINVPNSKLIVTVSYLGARWNVKDFTGEVQSGIGKDIGFKNLVDNYFNKQVKGRKVEGGFDPERVASYLNVINIDKSTEQIWYEDFLSLYKKYTWTLKNGYGGVSIRAMGYDDGYSELRNALASTLIEIDTVYTDTLSLIVDTLPALTCNDYAKIFVEDFKWAIAVNLEYELPDTTIKFTYKTIKDSVNFYQDSVVIWHHWQPYEKGKKFNSPQSAYYIFARWKKYANYLFIIWTVAIGLIALLYLITLYLNKYKRGSNTTRLLIKIGQAVSLIFFISALLLWMYLSPSFNLIGAGSDGSSMKIIFLSLFIGAVIGWFIHSWYNHGKYTKRNVP